MSIGESAKLYGLAAPERQGALGTKLAHAALEYARQNELTVVAICPFVKEYVDNHPEYQSFVTTLE